MTRSTYVPNLWEAPLGVRGAVRPHVSLAAMCAKLTRTACKTVAHTRRQRHPSLAATPTPTHCSVSRLVPSHDGRLAAIVHEGVLQLLRD